MINLLDIVIVNWNGGELIKKTINSLLQINHLEVINKIYIVDNNSNDNSINELVSHEKIEIIKNNINRGFGAACNQAIKKSTTKYFLLLNPDVVLFEDTIYNSVLFLENRNDLDILGVQQINDDGKYVYSCSRFPTPWGVFTNALGLHKILPKFFRNNILMTDYNYEKSGFVDQVMGAYMMIRSETVFKQIGIFDERFFVFNEELDLSKRLNDHGGKTFYNSEIKIIHSGGGTTNNVKAFRLFLYLQSTLRYNKKHFSFWGSFFSNIITCTLEFGSRIIFCLLRGDFSGVRETVTGYKYLIIKSKKYT